MLRERLNQLVLILAAVVFAWVGLMGLLAPATIAAPIDMGLEGASAHNEIRANYGGMHLGMCALFVAGALATSARRPATILLTVFTGGLVIGRLLSLVADGWPNTFIFQLLVLEAAAAASGAALLLIPQD
jgi:hypothetical protein